MCVSLGVVLPLVQGARPGIILFTTVVGVGVAGTAGFLFRQLRLAVTLVVLVGGAGVGSLLGLEDTWFVTWVFSVFLGALAGADLEYWWRHRTMPVGRSSGSSAGDGHGRLHLVRDEGHEDQAVSDPDDTVVLAAVRALNGIDRTFVSVFRGRARLDVCGDASGPLVVFCSDDRRLWHQLRTPEGSEDETVVRIGRVRGHYPLYETSTLDAALTAVTTWLTDGTRDSRLTWHSDQPGDEVVRPPALEATD